MPKKTAPRAHSKAKSRKAGAGKGSKRHTDLKDKKGKKVSRRTTTPPGTRRRKLGKVDPRTEASKSFNHSDVGRAIGSNLLDAAGGDTRMKEYLSESSNPKARQLLDRMGSSQHLNESFASKYIAVGLKPTDILEIISDAEQARTFIGAITSADDVMKSLVRAAKDEMKPHEKCNGSGKLLDRKTNEPTETECQPCYGTGYVLTSGARDAQELYFSLIRWTQQRGGPLFTIDARKQQVNVLNPTGLPAGEAPNVTSIIKRADQVIIPPARQLNAANGDSMIPDIIDQEAMEPEGADI